MQTNTGKIVFFEESKPNPYDAKVLEIIIKERPWDIDKKVEELKKERKERRIKASTSCFFSI